MTQRVQLSLLNNKLRDWDMECDHIDGIFFFQILVPKNQGTPLHLYMIVFNFQPLRFVSFDFSCLVSTFF